MTARAKKRATIPKAKLEEMIETATVDCYNESEQATGWFTALEDNVALPFETTVLEVPVHVHRFDLTEREEIVAICVRGKSKQAVPILELPLPSPRPAGTEWIEAYRIWSSGSW